MIAAKRNLLVERTGLGKSVSVSLRKNWPHSSYMAFPLSFYVSLTLFQVFRVVSTPVPDRTLDPNVQTCAQVMALQLHQKFAENELDSTKTLQDVV